MKINRSRLFSDKILATELSKKKTAIIHNNTLIILTGAFTGSNSALQRATIRKTRMNAMAIISCLIICACVCSCPPQIISNGSMPEITAK